ncbi:MAG: glycosyltransferase family 1 protein [Bacteroidales bacterium]
MRLGFDAKRAFHNYSGLGNYSRYVIANIKRFYPENECLLYTPAVADPDLFHEPSTAQIIGPEGPLEKLSPSLWRTFGVSRRLNRDRVDVFHGLSNELPFGIHRSRSRTVVTIHDLIFLEHPHLYKTLDRTIYLRKSEYAARHATRIIAVSEQTKQDIMRHLGVDESRIRVVYQGCSRQFYSRVSEDSLRQARDRFSLPRNYLLYVGTVEERKNLFRIVQALDEGKIDIPLVVVGRRIPAYANQVMAYIQRRNMKNIHFLDQVQVSDLPAIYQGATAFIYPSSYEGFGIPILEALNSRIPVITSAGGCLEETSGKGGLHIDPHSTGQMVEAIRSLLQDDNLRDRLILEGGSHALKFREEQTIPSLYQVYLECFHNA